ncbi:MAG: ribosome-associated translation inhibitor RaiA [Hyphomicrobiaceae bacterium]
MTTQITGKNLDIGESLRTHIAARIDEISAKYGGGTVSGHVVVEKLRSSFVTRCSLHHRSGMMLQSEADAGDPYQSAEAAFERLEKRLRRHKRRLRDHHGAVRNGDASPAIDYTISETADVDDAPEGHTPVTIAETSAPVRRLSVSEAVMTLDLADAPVVVFRNAGHGGINVVYRRPDGNIGWVDPGPSQAD